ncbi:MAG: Gfo/Idh/MocA family oxidoreductase [Phycisphaerae bacterium]
MVSPNQEACPPISVAGKIHSLYFRSRMGDGWGQNAYLDCQPYFRDYPRLLVYENGVHFIDTYRYLGGEVKEVYAVLRKLNPVIAGEDFGVIIFHFESGATGLWDANRYNESRPSEGRDENPRYTFGEPRPDFDGRGELLLDANGGSIRLYLDGRITIQLLGEKERIHDYHHEDRGLPPDSCYTTQRHFIDRMLDGKPFETNGREYLKTLAVQEAVYESASKNATISVGQ